MTVYIVRDDELSLDSSLDSPADLKDSDTIVSIDYNTYIQINRNDDILLVDSSGDVLESDLILDSDYTIATYNIIRESMESKTGPDIWLRDDDGLIITGSPSYPDDNIRRVKKELNLEHFADNFLALEQDIISLEQRIISLESDMKEVIFKLDFLETNNYFDYWIDNGNLIVLPIADAGPDQITEPKVPTEAITITLDASGSSISTNEELIYNWEKVSGPTILLDIQKPDDNPDADPVHPKFRTTQAGVYIFKLTVNTLGGNESLPDYVQITIVNQEN